MTLSFQITQIEISITNPLTNYLILTNFEVMY